jgi:DNA mismatch repair protein MutS2
MPASVIAAARENLTEREQQLAEHLARVDQDLRALEQERKQAIAERLAVAEAERRLRSREDSVREREDNFRKRLDAKLDDQLRAARKEIDTVIDGLKARAAELSQQAAVRLKSGERVRAAGISTGDMGTARGAAREALDEIVERLRGGEAAGPGKAGGESPLPSLAASPDPLAPVGPGVRVIVGGLGVEGTVIEVHGKHAEVDMRGKRLRAALRDLRVISSGRAGSAAGGPAVHVNVDLQPRAGSLTELNVIGNTVDEAIARLEKFLDESTVTDIRELRIVHGHGTGQLRRAIATFLKDHPLVARFDTAPQNQGGGGATIVELKD